MNKFEYTYIKAYYGELSSIKLTTSLKSEFNELGKQGWELIGVFSSVAWFKRRIMEVKPHEKG